MNEDVELLVQRFLDGELTRRERRQLLELLAEGPDLRERLLLDETMLDVAAALPRAVPAPDFVAQTLAKLPAQDETEAAAVSTRTIAMRWVAPMAAAAAILLAAGFVVGRRSAPAPAALTAAAPASAIVPVSDASEAVRVQMMLLDPGARSVVVVGDFNGWDPSRSPLQPRENGVWGTTLTLPPGRYHYMFVIDGKTWVADPLAGETSSDGFGARNSVLDVEA